MLNKIQIWVLSTLGMLGAILSTIIKSTAKSELDIVLPLAANAVAQIAADPTILLPGLKQEAAVAIILAKLSYAQIKVATSSINLAIELVVANRKALR